MGQPPFMWPELKKLLDRYYDGTKQVAADEEMTLVSRQGLPFNSEMEDLDRRAMESLLITQAHCLLNMYEVITTGTGSFKQACLYIPRRLKDLEHASYSRIYAYRFDQVPSCWRRIYSDTQVLTTFHILLKQLNKQSPPEQFEAFLKALDEVVARLDRSLVTTGEGGRILNKTWIEETFKIISEAWKPNATFGPDVEFSTAEPNGRPTLTRPCKRHQGWTINEFERHMNDGYLLAVETGEIGPRPVIFTDLTKDTWPALVERSWFRPNYLLCKTLGGRRLVPVEIGSTYVDDDWGQELLPFKDFIIRYIDNTATVDDTGGDAAELAPKLSLQTGYLAQHDLFRQIPALRNDILVPDFCWAAVPGHPFLKDRVRPKLQMPDLNAWFGPAGTVTPLHRDSYTNLLCQVVGTKFVRLYPPQAEKYMDPILDNPNGVDMSNTSRIDLGLIEGWERRITHDMSDKSDETVAAYMEDVKDKLSKTEYFECILEPGDTLLIPIGWWHYVRSLSVSFSVSFWWN